MFGHIVGEGHIVPRIAKYFLAPKDTSHHVSKVNINNLGNYDKYSVNYQSREYHLYNAITDKEGEDPAQDSEALQKTIAKKANEADWEGLVRTHKLVAKKPTGRIGLDYHYTLVTKILSKHLKVLP